MSSNSDIKKIIDNINIYEVIKKYKVERKVNSGKHIKRFKKKINKNKKIKIEIPKEMNEILVNMVKYR